MSTFITFYISTNPYETRGYNLKLFKKQSNLDIRKNSFSRHVIDSWNNLPGEIVNAATINNFKNSLDIINSDSMYLH